MSAFTRLIDQCGERYPHFESPRGQFNITSATKEYTSLVSTLRNIREMAEGGRATRATLDQIADFAAEALERLT